MTLSVDSNVDCYMDLCRGASLSRLKLKDDWILAWKEVSVCYLVVVPVELIVTVGRLKGAILLMLGRAIAKAK